MNIIDDIKTHGYNGKCSGCGKVFINLPSGKVSKESYTSDYSKNQFYWTCGKKCNEMVLELMNLGVLQKLKEY